MSTIYNTSNFSGTTSPSVCAKCGELVSNAKTVSGYKVVVDMHQYYDGSPLTGHGAYWTFHKCGEDTRCMTMGYDHVTPEKDAIFAEMDDLSSQYDDDKIEKTDYKPRMKALRMRLREAREALTDEQTGGNPFVGIA